MVITEKNPQGSKVYSANPLCCERVQGFLREVKTSCTILTWVLVKVQIPGTVQSEPLGAEGPLVVSFVSGDWVSCWDMGREMLVPEQAWFIVFRFENRLLIYTVTFS